MLFVDAVAFRLHAHQVAVVGHDIFEAVTWYAGDAVYAEFFAVVVPWECQGAARMFLFSQTEKVGGIADLGLDLFLAVSEVIVGQNGDDYAPLVASGDLERRAIVIQFFFIDPAHAISLLARRCGVPVGQPQFLLSESGQVRCQNHTAGVPGPVSRVQPDIV